MDNIIKNLAGFFKLNETPFPEEPKRFRTYIFLLLLKFKITLGKDKGLLGRFYIKPNFLSLFSWRNFVSFNPHHYGNFEKEGGFSFFESDVVNKMISLYGGHKKEYTGMITSGASEGNFISAILGKYYLENKGSKRICLLSTDLTHSSVSRAAQILNIPNYPVSLDSNLGISTDIFEQKILKLLKDGYYSFLICMTQGYKTTGTKDNFAGVEEKLRKIKKKHKNFNYFVWVDAALDGLISPFSQEVFLPFKSKSISSMTLDLHKLALSPYPSGMVLYKKILASGDVTFIKNGLFESRSGLYGIAAWSSLHDLGKKGLTKLVHDAQRKRAFFLKELQNITKLKKAISLDSNISLLLYLNRKQFEIFRKLENHLPIRCHSLNLDIGGKSKKLLLARIYFLPSLKDSELNQALNVLSNKL
jgi:glutamate/tyrosine decarboxylase-like PLP-dependent enzyme